MTNKHTSPPQGSRLKPGFYQRTDVVQVAKDLLGMVLVTEFEGARTAGLITEVEAYRAPDDRACHAFGNRRTPRTEIMFQDGGRAYIYICYGIHHLFNVVTAQEGMAHAVLVRAIEPLDGLDKMYERRGQVRPSVHKKNSVSVRRLTTGPGALAQALGLHSSQSGQSLFTDDSPVWIEDQGLTVSGNEIAAGKRIGVESAGASATWEWRFWIRGTGFVKSPNW